MQLHCCLLGLPKLLLIVQLRYVLPTTSCNRSLPEDQPNSELANVHFQDGRMLFAQKAESPVAKPPEGPGVGPANQPVVHPSDQVAAVPAPSVLKRPLGEVNCCIDGI